MRFAAASVLALPLLAAAQVDSPLDQLKAQVNSWVSFLQTYIPNPDSPHTPEAAAAKAGGRAVHILTLNDWEETIKSRIQPGATADSPPEQWWIFTTGGNKTCFGRCGSVEKAFNETAALWSVDPTAPHLAYLNCESQPVLCNSWAAGAPSLWIMDVKPSPAKSQLWISSLGTNETTAEAVKEFVGLRSTQSYKAFPVYDGAFHPLDGQIAQLGLGKAVGYFFWAFTVVPNWLFMVGISIASRSFMGNRMNPGAPAGRPGAPAAPAGRR